MNESIALQFIISILASIVGTAVYKHNEKINYFHWMAKYAKPAGITLLCLGIASFAYISINISVTKYQNYTETSYLQNRIDRYLKGKYPKDYKYGWRINILKIQPKLIISVEWPKKEANNPQIHPWENEHVKQMISEIVKKEGYGETPVWYRTIHPATNTLE